MNLSLTTYSGGVHEHKFVAELVIVGLYGISGSTGNRGYDISFRSQQCVGDGRLAYVRLTYYRYARKSCVRVYVLLLFYRKYAAYLVEKVTRSRTIRRRNSPYLPKSQ